MEILLRFFWTHFALSDVDSHLEAFFYKLKRKKYLPVASLGNTIQKRVHHGQTSFGKAATDRDTI